MYRITVCMLVLAGALATPTSAKDAMSEIREGLRSDVESERIAAIERLAEAETSSASSRLARMLRDRSADVRAAAARALGKRGGRGAIAALIRATEALDDDRALLGVVCEGLGRTGSARAVEPLEKIAMKTMGSEVELARAAIDALGRVRDRRSVEALIALLGSATPAQTSRTTNVGQPELLAPIRQALQRLTGQRMVSVSAWARWWRRVERGYRFPRDPKEELRGTVFVEEGFRFRIERPKNDSWSFSRPKTGLVLVRFTGPREATPLASVLVLAYSMKAFDPDTPEALAERYAKSLSAQFKDLRVRETGRSTKLSGEDAVYQRYLGLTRRGMVLERRYWIARHGEHIFTLRASLASGSSKRIRKELDEIVESFRFLED